jgi:hypothetical protein
MCGTRGSNPAGCLAPLPAYHWATAQSAGGLILLLVLPFLLPRGVHDFFCLGLPDLGQIAWLPGCHAGASMRDVLSAFQVDPGSA